MILKLALLTCAFYVLLSVLLEVGLAVVMHSAKEGVIVGGRFGAWVSVFAIVWLASFSVAFYVLFHSIRAKFPH